MKNSSTGLLVLPIRVLLTISTDIPLIFLKFFLLIKWTCLYAGVAVGQKICLLHQWRLAGSPTLEQGRCDHHSKEPGCWVTSQGWREWSGSEPEQWFPSKSTVSWGMSEAEPEGLGQSEGQGGGRAGTDTAPVQQWGEPVVQPQPKSSWVRTSLLVFSW